jgi:hypothetical protein
MRLKDFTEALNYLIVMDNTESEVEGIKKIRVKAQGSKFLIRVEKIR